MIKFPHSLSTTQYKVNDWEVSSNKSTSIMLTYVANHCIPSAVPPCTSKVTSMSHLIQPHFITAHTSTDWSHELSLTVNSLCCKPTVTSAEKKNYIQYITHMKHQDCRSYATSNPLPPIPPNYLEMPTWCSWKTSREHLKWRLYKVGQLVSKFIYAKSAEMALPLPSEAFLHPSTVMAMLFSPFGCTHQPLLSHSFCSCWSYLHTLPEVTRHEAESLMTNIHIYYVS